MATGAECWSRARAPSPAETHGQAVPGVCVFLPPPASAIVLLVAPAAHRGPHTSTAHRTVAAALCVAMGSFHGQLHAIVLLQRQKQRHWAWHADSALCHPQEQCHQARPQLRAASHRRKLEALEHKTCRQEPGDRSDGNHRPEQATRLRASLLCRSAG